MLCIPLSQEPTQRCTHLPPRLPLVRREKLMFFISFEKDSKIPALMDTGQLLPPGVVLFLEKWMLAFSWLVP